MLVLVLLGRDGSMAQDQPLVPARRALPCMRQQLLED